jgi:hypothetical protein
MKKLNTIQIVKTLKAIGKKVPAIYTAEIFWFFEDDVLI